MTPLSHAFDAWLGDSATTYSGFAVPQLGSFY